MWRQTVYLLLVILMTVANGAKHCPSATAFMQEYKEVLDQKQSEGFAKELKNMYDYEKSGELTHAAADNVCKQMVSQYEEVYSHHKTVHETRRREMAVLEETERKIKQRAEEVDKVMAEEKKIKKQLKKGKRLLRMKNAGTISAGTALSEYQREEISEKFRRRMNEAGPWEPIWLYFNHPSLGTRKHELKSMCRKTYDECKAKMLKNYKGNYIEKALKHICIPPSSIIMDYSMSYAYCVKWARDEFQRCECPNGMPVQNYHCPETESVRCKSCNKGFFLDNGACRKIAPDHTVNEYSLVDVGEGSCGKELRKELRKQSSTSNAGVKIETRGDETETWSFCSMECDEEENCVGFSIDGYSDSPPHENNLDYDTQSFKCSMEGEICECDGTVIYKYGEKWSKDKRKDVRGSIQCSTEVFGSPEPKYLTIEELQKGQADPTFDLEAITSQWETAYHLQFAIQFAMKQCMCVPREGTHPGAHKAGACKIYLKEDQDSQAHITRDSSSSRCSRRTRKEVTVATFHLAPAGAHVCDYGVSVPQNECEAAAASLHSHSPGRQLQVGSGGSCLDGGWGQVPFGCSIQSRGDWAAHFKTSGATQAGCVHEAYQLVCSGLSMVELGCWTDNRARLFDVMMQDKNLGLNGCRDACVAAGSQYIYMGYEYNSECYCGIAGENYQAIGMSNNCKAGLGGSWAMNVYGIRALSGRAAPVTPTFSVGFPSGDADWNDCARSTQDNNGDDGFGDEGATLTMETATGKSPSQTWRKTHVCSCNGYVRYGKEGSWSAPMNLDPSSLTVHDKQFAKDNSKLKPNIYHLTEGVVCFGAFFNAVHDPSKRCQCHSRIRETHPEREQICAHPDRLNMEYNLRAMVASQECKEALMRTVPPKFCRQVDTGYVRPTCPSGYGRCGNDCCQKCNSEYPTDKGEYCEKKNCNSGWYETVAGHCWKWHWTLLNFSFKDNYYKKKIDGNDNRVSCPHGRYMKNKVCYQDCAAHTPGTVNCDVPGHCGFTKGVCRQQFTDMVLTPLKVIGNAIVLALSYGAAGPVLQSLTRSANVGQAVFRTKVIWGVTKYGGISSGRFLLGLSDGPKSNTRAIVAGVARNRIEKGSTSGYDFFSSQYKQQFYTEIGRTTGDKIITAECSRTYKAVGRYLHAHSGATENDSGAVSFAKTAAEFFSFSSAIRNCNPQTADLTRQTGQAACSRDIFAALSWMEMSGFSAGVFELASVFSFGSCPSLINNLEGYPEGAGDFTERSNENGGFWDVDFLELKDQQRKARSAWEKDFCNQN